MSKFSRIESKNVQNRTKKTIVLAEGEDIRTVKAADMILKEGIADIILLGDKKKIAELATGLDLSKAQILDPATDERRQEFADKFYEMRKAKGMTPEKAFETMANPLYFGVMMVKLGLADGQVAGAVNSTSNVLSPLPANFKNSPGNKAGQRIFCYGCS